MRKTMIEARDTYDFASVEMMMDCPKCGAGIALNSPTRHLQCPSCASPVSIPDRVWEKTLAGIERKVQTWGFGASYPARTEEPGLELDYSRGRIYPPCPRCSQPMTATGDGVHHDCVECGERGSARPAPDWLESINPHVVGYVGEDAKEDAKKPKEKKQAVSISCASCGAKLVTDGSTRGVECEYCDTLNVLPDSVWQALHPPSIRRPWWLLLRVPKDRRTKKLTSGSLALSWLWLPALLYTGVVVFTAGGWITLNQFVLGWPLGLGLLAAPYGIMGLIALADYMGLRKVVRPENEVVGRLGERESDMVEIEIFDPAQPEQILGTEQVKVPKVDYERLGREGGLVRAWKDPEQKRFKVHLDPTGLVLAGAPVD